MISDRFSFSLLLAVMVMCSPLTARSQDISTSGSYQHLLSQSSKKQTLFLSKSDWQLISGYRFPSDSLFVGWLVNSLRADYSSSSNKTSLMTRSDTRMLQVSYSGWFSLGRVTATINRLWGYHTSVTGGGIQIGIPLGWFGEWAIQADRTPWLYEQRLTVSDSRAVFTQRGVDDAVGLSLIGWTLGGIHLSGEFQLGNRYPLKSQETFQDKGAYRFSQLKAEISGEAQNNRWTVFFESFTQSGHPELDWKKTRFSDIPEDGFTHWSAGFSAERSFGDKWSGSLCGSMEQFNVNAAGYLQSFPFAGGAVAFLGDYFFFDVKASYRLAGLSGAATWQPTDAWTLETRSGYFLFDPVLETATWQPIAFLIGRRNEKTSRLSWKSVHLIPVEWLVERKGKWGTFSLRFHQWIPVYLQKQPGNRSSGSSGGGSPDGSSKTTGSGSEGWGGTTISLSWQVTPEW